MTLDDYKNNLLSTKVFKGATNIIASTYKIIQTIGEVLDQKNYTPFIIFIHFPPDDAINEYNQSSSFDRKWIAEGRPVILILRLDSIDVRTNEESLASYDIRYIVAIDAIYPYYNVNETENSALVFYEFMDNFAHMFEQSGRKWKLNGERIFVDRNAIDVGDVSLALYANTLCHVTTFRVEFLCFMPIVTDELEITI